MADSDFRVKAIIEANTSNFDKGMKQAQASATNLSNTFGNLSKVITKALSFAGLTIGTKAIVDFGKSCVQSANQAVKTFNILDNTIKATGADAWTSTKELDSMVKTLSDSTNYSVTEIENMQSVLLGFREITGETFQDASDAVLDMATVMGMDLTSAVQTIGKALDDPIRGLDSLRRQGFQFTDEQKAELAQMVKNGKKIEAQKIILDELANSYGGASKAGQDSFAKQRHAVENFKDALGTKLIPLVKVFAEDNAKMINSLRDLVEKTDFTPMINVVTNLKKIVSETFERISDYMKKVGAEVQDFISRFNFKPLVSILDTLAGVVAGVINKFKEINSQKLEIFDQIKESVISFSNSDLFQNIVSFINKIIDAIFFLWSELQDVMAEIRNLVVSKIIEIWNKVKELFENSQNALANSGQDIASWGDLFYDVLNNIFRIFQDFFNLIKALIHGDWSVAWEYAKLTVMRMADNILNIFSTIANAFPDLINGILKGWNKIIEQINKARAFFGQDPLDLAGMFESVDLSKKTGLEKKIEDTEKKIQELTGHTADITIKDLEGVSTQFAGFTSHALGFIQGLTDGVATETEKQKKYFSGVTSDTESTYKAFSEWDSKLLQQRLEDLSEWSDEAHEINLQLIEEERKKALEADKTGADTEKINKYYNRKIEKENERAEQVKRNMIKETTLTAINQLKSIASNTVTVFKKVVSTIKNVFSGITNIFSKMFEFDPDEALVNLLKFEDSILTFFVETLPKLPSFFASAIQSIIILVETLLNSIDWEKVQEILNSIIDTIVKNAPTIVETLLNLVLNIAQTLLNAIIHFVESGGWKMLLDMMLKIQKRIEQFVVDNINEVVQTIIDMLPDLIQFLIDSIVSASKTLGKLIKPILTLIVKLIEAIVDVAFSDEVIDASMGVIEDFITAIIEVIIELLPKILPKIIGKMLKVILRSLISFPIEIAKAFIQGLSKAFTQTNWGQFVKDMFEGFIEGVKNFFGIHSPSTVFENFGQYMIEGLWNGIKNMGQWLNENVGNFFTNMINGISQAFNNVGGGIQNIFSNIWNSITNVFGNVGNWFSNIFTQAVNGIKNAFYGIGEWFRSLWEGFANAMKTPINSVISGINEMITQMNKISVTIPSWVPAIGGRTFGINLSKLNYLATGTQNAQKGLAIVGEAGPELVKFNGGEQVLNNRNTNKAIAEAGKSTNNFNVTFNNLQDTTAFAMMQQLKQYNRQMAINGVI